MLVYTRLLVFVAVAALFGPSSAANRTLFITVDDVLELHIDGEQVITLPNWNRWPDADAVELSNTTYVIAVKGNDVTRPAGILASFTNSDFVTNGSWKCTSQLEDGWTSPEFDDNAWPAADVIAQHGAAPWYNISGISRNASWIWTNDNATVIYCRAIFASINEFLVVSDYNTHNVYQVNPSSGHYTSLFSASLDKPQGVTYDPVRNDVYVADYGTGIWRHSLFDGRESVVHNESATNFTAITFDETTGGLYYANWGQRSIGYIDVVSVEFHHTLLLNTTGQPYGIIVDIYDKVLYWTEESPAAIRRAHLADLINSVPIIITAIRQPRALTADFKAGVLYWGDAFYERIETSNVDGSGRSLIATEPGSRYHGFAIDRHFLYIADNSNRCLRKMHRRTANIEDQQPCIFQGAISIALGSTASQKVASAA